MSDQIDWTAAGVFIAFFLLVTVMGFFAGRWKRGNTPAHLDEWGLGGRQFGTWITWFLVGGDFYTAYTVIAVPALVYAVGAYGFFALPYTIIVYPIVFAIMPVLWKNAHANGHVTAADVVKGHFGSQSLELAVAITGIVATMPYIALQLIGMGAVIKAMGLTGELPIVAGLRRARALHLQLRSARARADRLRQGHHDLYRGAGRGGARACETRRLCRGVCGGQRRVRRQGRRDRPDTQARAISSLRHAGARFGAGGLHVSPHADRHLRVEIRRHHPQERDPAAGLHAAARPHRPARLHGLCRSHHSHLAERGGADAVQDAVPGVVRGLRVCGHRHRRAGARRRHEHRRGKPVHPAMSGRPTSIPQSTTRAKRASPRSPRWW